MGAYLKAIVAAVGVLALVVHAAVADQSLSLDEAQGIWQAVLAVLTAVGVYSVPNRPA